MTSYRDDVEWMKLENEHLRTALSWLVSQGLSFRRSEANKLVPFFSTMYEPSTDEFVFEQLAEAADVYKRLLLGY
jgi:hypothetical protein